MRDCGEVLALAKPPRPNPPATVPKGLLNQKQEQKQEQEDSSDLVTESDQAPQVSEFRIPLNDGTEYGVLLSDIEEWRLAYQAVDIESELRQMRTWSMANPTKKKTSRGVPAFIVKWLSKAQDNPGAARAYAGGGGGSAMAQETFV